MQIKNIFDNEWCKHPWDFAILQRASSFSSDDVAMMSCSKNILAEAVNDRTPRYAQDFQQTHEQEQL